MGCLCYFVTLNNNKKTESKKNVLEEKILEKNILEEKIWGGEPDQKILYFHQKKLSLYSLAQVTISQTNI